MTAPVFISSDMATELIVNPVFNPETRLTVYLLRKPLMISRQSMMSATGLDGCRVDRALHNLADYGILSVGLLEQLKF